MTTISALRQVTSNLSRESDIVRRSPIVSRESAHYLARIESIRSVDEFLADRRIMTFALNAFGLGEMNYAKAFIGRVLREGIDRPDALANKLSDPRFREFASTFNFARYGATTTVFERTRGDVVDRYVRTALEEKVGATNEAVRLALYFERKAPDIKSPYGLLADRALFEVARTALGLPEQMANLDIDRQADIIAKKIDVSDFKDGAKLRRFTERFAALWDASRPFAPANILLPQSGGPSAIASVDVAALTRLQTLRTFRS